MLTKRLTKKQKREEAERRLVECVEFINQHPPEIMTRPVIRTFANRFAVHPKTLETAIDILARGTLDDA